MPLPSEPMIRPRCGAPPVHPASPAPGGPSPFRDQAVRSHREGRRPAPPLRLASPWVDRTYRLLVVVLVGIVAAGFLGRVREYATGPAVVQLEGLTRVTALSAGTVERVAVAAGQRVRAGQLLVQLHGESERLVVEHLETKFERELVRLLRDPADDAARAAASSIRAELELARAQLEQRSLVAAEDGWVHDIRVREGQSLPPGDPLLSLTTREHLGQVVAFLPGHFRPLLKSGQPLRLRLDGYPDASARLELREISDQLIGREEIRRLLGPELADAVVVPAPAVVVRADLPGTSFSHRGRDYPFYSGMQCTVEARLREENVLTALFPALGRLLNRTEDI